MNEYLAYLDESGDPIINDSASKHFFIGATLIQKNEKVSIEKSLNKIKNRNDLRELKSSRVSEERRFKVCESLADLNIKIFTIWVDKKMLVGDWFQYKNEFYKYVHRRIHNEIFRHFKNVHVTLDKYGSPTYQKSLKQYLIGSFQTEIFEPSIDIGSAKNNPFIQISDFTSGTLRKALKGDFKDNQRFLNLLKPLWQVRIKLPDDGVYVDSSIIKNSDKYISICLDESKRYLEANSNNKSNAKIKTLEYLYHTALENPNEYVYTAEILDWLSDQGVMLSEEQFRNKVTASLRDEGLIISGTSKGLKIPTSIKDFEEYVSFSIHIALPMLKRLKKAITYMSIKTDRPNLDKILSTEMQNILNEVNA